MTARTAQGCIVFSHANGFPAGTYQSLFEIWRDAGYTVAAVEKFGHDARYPVSNNWPYLRDQLIGFIDAEGHAPAYLVGHSLGGYINLLVAARRPDLALGVVLLDSPVLSGWKARALQFAKAAGVGERFSPARISRRRRQHWPSAEAAFEHFAAKSAFACWPPRVLHDYIASGTEPEASHGSKGRRLSFDREIESAIYNSLPHHIPRLLQRRPLQCPLAFVQGSESHEVRQVGLTATRRLTQGRMSTLPGSHLFPFEHPVETAAEVLRWIEIFKALAAAGTAAPQPS